MLQSELIKWYKLHARDLPWRKTKDPYRIWLSEVILQQTRVDQGLSYYNKFVDAFPTVQDLANAEQDQVLKLWQGLGYYSRARNLHKAAKQIASSQFPENYQELLDLSGVGNYTAAAIASFAYNEDVAVVDGNVYRVLSRFYGIETPIDSTLGKKEFQNVANEILVKGSAGIWNQAMMEFGALQCTPKNPDCSSCPIASGCVSLKKDKVSSLPFKAGKQKVKQVYLTYFFIKHNRDTYITKRPQTGIWAGLYEFPKFESTELVGQEEVISTFLSNSGVSQANIVSTSRTYTHILSHRRISCQFIEIEVKGNMHSTDYKKVAIKKLKEFPVSRLMEKYLEGE